MRDGVNFDMHDSILLGERHSIKIQFIDNVKNTHISQIKDCIKGASLVLLCVAFLKESGLKSIIQCLEKALSNGAKVKLYIGIDFYFTEPLSLKNLLKLFNKYESGELYLCKFKRKNFHPKLYFFKKGDNADVIVGSANMTEGGLETNIEMSIRLNLRTDSPVYKDITWAIANLENDPFTVKANDVRLECYERDYRINRKHENESKHKVKKELMQATKLPLHSLENYINKYITDEHETRDFTNKVYNYKKAKQILDQLKSEQIVDEKHFLSLYEILVRGKRRLWHSGGIDRSKTSVARKFQSFIELVKELDKNIKDDPINLYRIVLKYTSKKSTSKIIGLGPNVPTEIMHTLAPARFAVLNNNPISSLRLLTMKYYPTPASFNPETYDNFIKTMKELADKTELGSLSKADHFLNYIYQNEVKRQKR